MLFPLLNVLERGFDVAAPSWVNSLQEGSGALRAGISPLGWAEPGILHLPVVVLWRVRALTPFAGGVLGVLFQPVTLNSGIPPPAAGGGLQLLGASLGAALALGLTPL